MENYNFKYAIPFLQIKTTQVDAIYIKSVTQKHNFYIQEVVVNYYTVLINNMRIELKDVHDIDIGNKIYNEKALSDLKPNTPVKIKIRTEDYENLIKNGRPNRFTRFYELEVNGEFLYQKRGLKEDFEVATF